MSEQTLSTEQATEQPEAKAGWSAPSCSLLPEPFYADEWVTIYHGDSREIMPHLKPFDLLLTDPPYGINLGIEGKCTKERRAQVRASSSRKAQCIDWPDDWDDQPAPPEMIQAARALCKRQIIFGGNFFDLPPTSCLLVWDKDNGNSSFADGEVAWSNLKGAVRIKRHRWHGMLRKGNEAKMHPSQKPLEVMAWALKQAGEVQTVLDPWMGGGTTLRACKDAHVHCVGIERERKYCEIAVDRMAQTTMGF